MKKRSKGFTLIELLFSLVVVITLTSGFYWFFTSLNADIENSKKRANLIRLAEGIKASAKLIIEIYTPYCTTGTIAAEFGWGWYKSGCDRVRIFPVLSNNMLIFEFNESILSVEDRNRLKSEIKSYFGDFCKVDASSPNVIRVSCFEFDRIFYCPATADNCNDINKLVTSVHNPGQSYDYVSNRIVALVVEYTERGRGGEIWIQHRVGASNEYEMPYFGDFSNFYQEMSQRNYEKFLNIYNALKKYEVTKRISEMKNTAPEGLDEISDYYVPWVYQITANTLSNAYAMCNDTSSSNCANLQSNNYWDRTIGPTNMYIFIKRVIDYFLGGDVTYLVDAWGNPIGIELLADLRSSRVLFRRGMSSNSIRWSNPPYPQTNYDNATTMRPPYVGFIYSEFCNNLDNATQSVCRMPIVYAN